MSTKFAGFLFIGDPHVSSRRIGRRQDDYTTSVLQKLAVCAALCREHNLMPVILGDLFHRYGDNGLSMLNRLMRVLKEFPVPPLTLEGNHDTELEQLGDEDALQLLAEAGVVQVLTTAGVVNTWKFGEQEVILHAVPHGSPIPEAVPAQPGVLQFMITHHDLAFGHAYPGALPLKAIENIDMVVNGHMHDTKPSALHGGTHWHNPGNIEPLSVDLANHVPKAWAWRPGQSLDALVGYELPHGKDLFDLTGLQVEAVDSTEAVQQLVEKDSEFAAVMIAESTLDAAKTDDAAVLQDDLEAVLSAASASEGAALLMRTLMAKVANAAVTS